MEQARYPLRLIQNRPRHPLGPFHSLGTRRTSLDTHRYATWRIPLKGVLEIFGDTYQHYHRVIFKTPVLSNILRGAIKPVHNILYRNTTSDVDGTLQNAKDLLNIFRGTTTDHMIKPAVYTYVLDRDDVWRFSETGRGALDYVSNHVMHSEASPIVRYSGEFHWRLLVYNYWTGFQANALEDN
ncbi:hypothetical protein FRB95_010771 [Tulasnella sp. JGI-2019a]|nr:hypothetical protein FRB95_010771 [Tulasnella sp. JGI-2019a]